MKNITRNLCFGALAISAAFDAFAAFSPMPDNGPISLKNPVMWSSLAKDYYIPFDPNKQLYMDIGGAATIALGAIPSVRVIMGDLGSYDANGNLRIDVAAGLEYQVALYSPTPDPIEVSVFTKTSYGVETLFFPSYGGSAQGQVGAQFLLLDGFDHSIADGMACGWMYIGGNQLESVDCTDPENKIKPFSFWMTPNTPYTVELSAWAQAQASGGNRSTAFAYVDPIFSIIGDAPIDAQFFYSPGVTHYTSQPAAIPEPPASALVAGSVLALLLSRKRRN